MKKFIFLYIFLGMIVFALEACSTPAQQTDLSQSSSSGDLRGEAGKADHTDLSGNASDSYQDILDKWTRTEKAYSGFLQSMQVTASLLSTELIEGQVAVDAKEYHWTSDQVRDARQKALYDTQSSTTVFLSFYTAKDETNNLDKTKTDWNLYLEVNGKRVLPESIKRVYETKSSLSYKYPYVTAWNRQYTIRFPMAVSVVTAGSSVLVIAGPLGEARLSF